MPYLRPTLFPITVPGPGRLATMPRPRGDDWLNDEMTALRAHGVDVVVSLLTRSEQVRLGLTGEASAATRAGLRYRELPVPDMSVPDHADADPVLDVLTADLAAGRYVAVHCRAGIGRSATIAAALLIRHGAAAGDAWATISAARGREVPETDEQRAWVLG